MKSGRSPDSARASPDTAPPTYPATSSGPVPVKGSSTLRSMAKPSASISRQVPPNSSHRCIPVATTDNRQSGSSATSRIRGRR